MNLRVGGDALFHFRQVDLDRDWDTLVAFHRDVFRISYGSDQDFSEATYRTILQSRLKQFPDGQMLVLDGGDVAGQVEIWIREHEGRRVGYVSLFYLAPAWRGQGRGAELLEYAERYVAKHGLEECHLRVSDRNERAMRFYERYGFVRVGSERREHLVWRMMKRLSP